MAAPSLKIKRGTAPTAVPNTTAGEPIVRYNSGITEFYIGDDGATTSKLVADSGATSAANEILTAFTAETVDGNADGVDASILLTSQDITGSAITIQPPSNLGGDYTLTLPTSAGAIGNVLQTDGNGVLSWATTGTTNDSTITLSAGAGLADGGSFTTNQGSNATITFNVGAGNGISVAADAVAIDTAITADLTTAQTLENKTVVADTFLIEDGTDTTIKAAFDISGNTSATTRTYTLPDASGTVALQGALGTITLGTDTTGNYVAAVTTAADSGLVGGNVAAEGTTSALALKNAAGLTANTLLKWDDGNGQLTDSSITDDGTTVTITGNFTVTGTTTTASVETTNTQITDALIELANGTTAATLDAGLIIERGTVEDNVFIGFDEGLDLFVAGTTTITGTGSDAAPTPIAFLALQYNVTDTAGTNEAVISYLAGNVDYTGQPAGRYLSNITIDGGEY